MDPSHDSAPAHRGPHELGTDSAGIWTRSQALEVLSRGRIQAALRRGDWVELWPCVFADAGFVHTPEQRAFAAVLACGGADQPVPVPGSGTRRRLRAYAFGRTAARVHDLPLIDDDDPATGGREHRHDDVGLWSPGRDLRRPQPDGLIAELTRHQPTLSQGDLMLLPSGLWTTSPLRTLIDCARLLSFEALVCAIDDALHRSLVTREDLDRAVRARTWSVGAVALRQAVRLSDGRAESPAETLARLLLLPVLPDLEPQVRVHDAAGRILARLDLGDRRRRFAVEVDGRRGHAGEAMVAKDRARDRTTEAQGWHTERCTWFELRCRQAELVRRMRAAGEVHRRPGRTAS